ncbi:unnamed protein product [Cuscuta campestris]|uniref:Uncharacterized protein n=1 Tax=Cuscuta campestris TaxID=132261 RepID=A0A484MZB4_9ASTE|nr:unnamed protein product [Cuscuta campestris]
MTYIRKFSGRETGRIGPKVTEVAEADRMTFAEAIFDGPSSWFCQVGLGVVGLGHFPVGLDTPIPGSPPLPNSSADERWGVSQLARFHTCPLDSEKFPECHTFIRHPRPAATPELQAHAQKLLEDCRPKSPHMYTVCTEQNLAEVGILISLERQFELSEAVLGSRPKHGLEESAPRSEDIESGDNEREDGGEAGNDEEPWQPSCSEGVAGDMNPVEVIRKAKLLARNRGRGAEVQRGSPPVGATGSVASARTQEEAPARNQRKRKLIQVEDEETTSEQDVVLTESPTGKRRGYPRGGKSPTSLNKADGNVHAEAEAASLSATLKDEDEILSSLQGLMNSFHKQVRFLMS